MASARTFKRTTAATGFIALPGPGRVLTGKLFQIALGYADANDATWLRADPLLKAACGAAVTGALLSSQPTLSRLENAPKPHHVEAMRLKLSLDWNRRLDPERTEIVLYIDASAFEG